LNSYLFDKRSILITVFISLYKKMENNHINEQMENNSFNNNSVNQDNHINNRIIPINGNHNILFNDD